jgi:hypothetical protein
MNGIGVAREVALVANGVLPITPLPDAAFALGSATRWKGNITHLTERIPIPG